MDEITVKRFLKLPSRALVDLAIEMANLNWREQTAIELCVLKGYTQEVASERAFCSVDSMQRWYRMGIEKLIKAWTGCWWIEELSK